MRLLHGEFVICVLGIVGSQSTVMGHDDGYIGCYQYPKDTKVHIYEIKQNNGKACREFCFSHNYTFAGTKYGGCYCGNYKIGTKVASVLCNAECPGIAGALRKCGGPFRFTMYDKEAFAATVNAATTKVPVTSTTTTIPTTTGSTTTGSMNQSVSTNATEFVPTITTNNLSWYIAVPVVFVLINIIVGFTLVCLCRSRHNRESQKMTSQVITSQVIQNNLYDEPDEPRNMNRVTTDLPALSLQNGSDETASSYYDTATHGHTHTFPKRLQNYKTNVRQVGNNMTVDVNIEDNSYDRINFHKSLKVQFMSRKDIHACQCNNRDTYNTLHY